MYTTTLEDEQRSAGSIRRRWMSSDAQAMYMTMFGEQHSAGYLYDDACRWAAKRRLFIRRRSVNSEVQAIYMTTLGEQSSDDARWASHRRTSSTSSTNCTGSTDYSSSHRRFRRQLMSTVQAVTWLPRPTCSRRASPSLVESRGVAGAERTFPPFCTNSCIALIDLIFCFFYIYFIFSYINSSLRKRL